MNCQEAERLVVPYLRGELDGDVLEDFLAHTDSCPECREELEIYYMVNVGLKQLDAEEDQGFGTFNFAGRLRQNLADSRSHVRHLRSMRLITYVAESTAVVAVLSAVAMQLRIWFL